MKQKRVFVISEWMMKDDSPTILEVIQVPDNITIEEFRVTNPHYKHLRIEESYLIKFTGA